MLDPASHQARRIAKIGAVLWLPGQRSQLNTGCNCLQETGMRQFVGGNLDLPYAGDRVELIRRPGVDRSA